MSRAQQQYTRTRIVCISDTHNCTVKLPKGDVLIHAGDLTNQGSYSELSRAVAWLEDAEFEAKIVIGGNHDITLDADFYSRHGQKFHNQDMHSARDCIQLLTSSSSLIYLNHESTVLHLRSPQGPRTSFTVFGSPFSPRYGQWAFTYAVPEHPEGDRGGSTLTTMWESIPDDADLVVTHTPPRGHCDATLDQRPGGCEALRRALWRVRPLLSVCGHIHDGRGAERVQWKEEADSMHDLQPQRFAEKSVSVWDDPGAGNNRMSLLDLTGRKGAAKLQPRETCIVNCAIMKSKYPHPGGKTFNKPVVVDIDLPIWPID